MNTEGDNAGSVDPVVLLLHNLEREVEDDRKRIDYHVSVQEYGHAEYYRGREHANALAALRVKRLMIQRQQNDPN